MNFEALNCMRWKKILRLVYLTSFTVRTFINYYAIGIENVHIIVEIYAKCEYNIFRYERIHTHIYTRIKNFNYQILHSYVCGLIQCLKNIYNLYLFRL